MQSSGPEVHNYLQKSSCNPMKHIMDNSNLIVSIYMEKSIKIQRLHIPMSSWQNNTFEPRHVISNNVAFLQVQTQTSLCSPFLCLETPYDVWSVA